MIGWWIGVAKQTPEERDASSDKKAAIIASWEVGSDGLDWLNKLAHEGKVTRLFVGGYPTRYVGMAKEVLPLIADGPPKHSNPCADDHAISSRWIDNVVLDVEKIKMCAPDQILTIDAWDLS